jgi:hypothetical protein
LHPEMGKRWFSRHLLVLQVPASESHMVGPSDQCPPDRDLNPDTRGWLFNLDSATLRRWRQRMFTLR